MGGWQVWARPSPCPARGQWEPEMAPEAAPVWKQHLVFGLVWGPHSSWRLRLPGGLGSNPHSAADELCDPEQARSLTGPPLAPRVRTEDEVVPILKENKASDRGEGLGCPMSRHPRKETHDLCKLGGVRRSAPGLGAQSWVCCGVFPDSS